MSKKEGRGMREEGSKIKNKLNPLSPWERGWGEGVSAANALDLASTFPLEVIHD
jgi:hypothetical protein